MSDIDSKLSELRAAVSLSADTEELYQMIRQDVASEIRYQDLSIARLLITLMEIWQQNRRLFNLAFLFFARPTASIREIGRMIHESPATVSAKLARLAADHENLALLMALRKQVRK